MSQKTLCTQKEAKLFQRENALTAFNQWKLSVSAFLLTLTHLVGFLVSCIKILYIGWWYIQHDITILLRLTTCLLQSY
jgi:hypothetical protein